MNDWKKIIKYICIALLIAAIFYFCGDRIRGLLHKRAAIAAADRISSLEEGLHRKDKIISGLGITINGYENDLAERKNLIEDRDREISNLEDTIRKLTGGASAELDSLGRLEEINREIGKRLLDYENSSERTDRNDSGNDGGSDN